MPLIADAADRPCSPGRGGDGGGQLLVQLLARGGAVDLREVRAVVRDTFEIARYEPRDAARWRQRMGG